MKICIFGAGAIGGYLAARLVQDTAEDVTLVARGPHLEALTQRGLTLITSDETITVPVRCSEDPRELGPQDYVIVALKAPSVAGAVNSMLPLLHAGTAVVTAQNGIPWWFFHRIQGPYEGHRLESVDPGGSIWQALGPERALGCVVYPSCEIVEPGVVRHLDGKRFMLGEPDGSKSQRATVLSRALGAAGLKAPVRARIRDDIWLKLWGNVSFNPVSALTHATLEEMCSDPDTRSLIRRIMLEAAEIAEALGIELRVDVDKRIQWAAAVGAHKTSMLQDLERGRPMEIDALVGAVAELGRLTGVETPTLDTVLSLLRLRAASTAVRPSPQIESPTAAGTETGDRS